MWRFGPDIIAEKQGEAKEQKKKKKEKKGGGKKHTILLRG